MLSNDIDEQYQNMTILLKTRTAKLLKLCIYQRHPRKSEVEIVTMYQHKVTAEPLEENEWIWILDSLYVTADVEVLVPLVQQKITHIRRSEQQQSSLKDVWDETRISPSQEGFNKILYSDLLKVILC